MKLETFFEKFDQFVDAPNAVAKIRELVLNLAVQGRLVQQDAVDEDVEHLLTRNDETRRASAKSDKRADVNNLPLLSSDDRWEIAKTWTWRALADLVLFVDYRGKTPTKLSHGIRLLTARNVRKGEINLSPEEFLSKEDYHAWMTRGFPKSGDVLFTTEAPMGNAAVVNLTGQFALAQRIICFQSYGAVDSSFLVLQILSTQFQLILDKNGTGVTAKGIKASKLKQLPIALPPLAEQKRIVAKVNELMALCDRLEAQQQDRADQHAALARAALARFVAAPTPANLNLLFHPYYDIAPADIRKTILTLAVQGELVAQDVDACEWPTVTMKDVCLQITDGEHATPQRTSGGVPLATAKNVRDGFLDLANTDYVAQATAEKCWKRCKPRDQDVLMVCVGATTGRVCLAQNPPDIVLVRSVALIRPNTEQIAPSFLDLFLRSPDGQSQIWGNVKQSAQPCLYLGKMAEFAIKLPPLAEQRRIVAKVDQLLTLVEQLELQLAAARAAAGNLMEAVVAELTAVKGKS
jgi:type I restriction enzyme S subunit